MENANYSWGFAVDKDAKQAGGPQKLKEVATIETNVIEDFSFKMGPHDTLVVGGRIGCGKTSFLYSVMGETEKKGGKHNVKGSIAYVE
jgi:ABC-type branched-subunit amino acid transport system ATPase component